jgi:hypothetical protein
VQCDGRYTQETKDSAGIMATGRSSSLALCTECVRLMCNNETEYVRTVTPKRHDGC